MKAKEWIESPEGQAKLVEILKKSKQVIKRLDKKRKIDPASLRIPTRGK